MRKIRTVAASFAATGLAVLGVMAVPGAGANAATNQAIAGRSAARLSSGQLRVFHGTPRSGQIWKVPPPTRVLPVRGEREAAANRHP